MVVGLSVGGVVLAVIVGLIVWGACRNKWRY